MISLSPADYAAIKRGSWITKAPSIEDNTIALTCGEMSQVREVIERFDMIDVVNGEIVKHNTLIVGEKIK